MLSFAITVHYFLLDPLNLLPNPLASVQKTSNTSSPSDCQTGRLGRVYPWPQGREYVEVYVSSVANPSTFWVQILSSMAVQLDELVSKMTMYYSMEEAKVL